MSTCSICAMLRVNIFQFAPNNVSSHAHKVRRLHWTKQYQSLKLLRRMSVRVREQLVFINSFGAYMRILSALSSYTVLNSYWFCVRFVPMFIANSSRLRGTRCSRKLWNADNTIETPRTSRAIFSCLKLKREGSITNVHISNHLLFLERW